LQALVKVRQEKGLEYMKVEDPVPGLNEVVVKVMASGIGESDFQIYNWGLSFQWVEKYLPLIPGHEFSGEVVEVGKNVTRVKCGDRVTCMSSVGCGECYLCKKGLISLCENNRPIGIFSNGAFAEYVVVSENSCYRINDNVSYDIAALTETLAISNQTVEHGGNLFGKKVSIIGCDPIGLGICYFASVANARVWVFGKGHDAENFGIAKRLGAEDCLNIEMLDMELAAADITYNKGFDVTFNTSSDRETIQECIDITKRNGKTIVAGEFDSTVEIDLGSMVKSQKDLITSYGYSKNSFQRVIDCMGKTYVPFDILISHKFNLNQVDEAMALKESKRCAKIMFSFA